MAREKFDGLFGENEMQSKNQYIHYFDLLEKIEYFIEQYLYYYSINTEITNMDRKLMIMEIKEEISMLIEQDKEIREKEEAELELSQAYQEWNAASRERVYKNIRLEIDSLIENRLNRFFANLT